VRTIDLDSLEIFRAVVREGGVVRAAAHLNRVQSNVTTRIKQLEQRLGVALFRRQGRSLALTSAGQSLLVHSERLLRMAEEVETEMRSAPIRGPLRLGSMESTAGSRLPRLLGGFHRRWPDIGIELQTGTTATLIRKIANYELEAAFVGEPFSASGLRSLVAFEEELVLVTSKNHPAVKRATDLERATILAFSQGCSYRTRLEEWLAQDGVKPERVMELASYQAIIACAAAGTGCGLVPVSLLGALRASKDIRQHPLPDKFGLNRTHLIWTGEPSPALQQFLDTM
jgi:DNA-binding transcriptional LysR family regulator